MTEVQHTIKVRLGKQIVDILCPPFSSETQLDRWLAEFKYARPEAVIISKSWASNAS